jgi:hypothetical protein
MVNDHRALSDNNPTSLLCLRRQIANTSKEHHHKNKTQYEISIFNTFHSDLSPL